MFTFGGTVGVAIAPFLALLMARQLAPIPVLLPAGLGMMLVAVLWALLPADRQPQTAGPTVTKRVSSSRWLLLRGPIGRITIVQSTASLGALTFVGTMPMHLVRTTGLAVDSALISWTLALFSVASATGGVVASALARRIAPRYLVPVAMLLALAPLVASYLLTTTHVPFFIAVALAGALLHAGLPMLVVRAQNLAAGSTSAASGMVLGLAAAAAAVGYLALGGLQSVVGSSTVMALGFAPVIGGAFLARTVLGGRSRVRNLRARRRLPA